MAKLHAVSYMATTGLRYGAKLLGLCTASVRTAHTGPY